MSRLPLRCFALLGLLAIGLAAAPRYRASLTPDRCDHEKILHYVRERFSIPDAVKITMTDLRATAYPDFLETTVTLDDGKDKRITAAFRFQEHAVHGGGKHLQSWAAIPATTLCG